jgi:hypothetical protein
MPQYMLLIYPSVDTPPPGDPAARLSRWQDYTSSLEDAGVIVTSGRLQDVHSATSVRVLDGETLISDGPFAETKEYLAGFYLLDCPDLDTALSHAARMPASDRATVEVRPMMFPAGTPPTVMAAQMQA